MGDQYIRDAYELYKRFKEDVKYKNRFFIDDDIKNIFDDIIEENEKLIEPEQVLYRARIHKIGDKEKPFVSIEEIGMPKSEYCGNGRVNPKGMRIFYLAGEKNTVISEVRPSIGDEITIGTFKTTEHLKILEIEEDGASYGLIDSEVTKSKKSDMFLLMFATYFNMGFSKTIKESERELEYLPTQIFAEYCKVKGIEGIGYPSSVVDKRYTFNEVKPNYNYAFFSDKGIEYVDSELITIEKIEYKYK